MRSVHVSDHEALGAAVQHVEAVVVLLDGGKVLHLLCKLTAQLGGRTLVHTILAHKPVELLALVASLKRS